MPIIYDHGDPATLVAAATRAGEATGNAQRMAQQRQIDARAIEAATAESYRRNRRPGFAERFGDIGPQGRSDAGQARGTQTVGPSPQTLERLNAQAAAEAAERRVSEYRRLRGDQPRGLSDLIAEQELRVDGKIGASTASRLGLKTASEQLQAERLAQQRRNDALDYEIAERGVTVDETREKRLRETGGAGFGGGSRLNAGEKRALGLVSRGNFRDLVGLASESSDPTVSYVNGQRVETPGARTSAAIDAVSGLYASMGSMSVDQLDAARAAFMGAPGSEDIVADIEEQIKERTIENLVVNVPQQVQDVLGEVKSILDQARQTRGQITPEDMAITMQSVISGVARDDPERLRPLLQMFQSNDPFLVAYRRHLLNPNLYPNPLEEQPEPSQEPRQ